MDESMNVFEGDRFRKHCLPPTVCRQNTLKKQSKSLASGVKEIFLDNIFSSFCLGDLP